MYKYRGKERFVPYRELENRLGPKRAELVLAMMALAEGVSRRYLLAPDPPEQYATLVEMIRNMPWRTSKPN